MYALCDFYEEGGYDIVPIDWIDGDVEEGMDVIVNWRRGKTVVRSPAVIKNIDGKRRLAST